MRMAIIMVCKKSNVFKIDHNDLYNQFQKQIEYAEYKAIGGDNA